MSYTEIYCDGATAGPNPSRLGGAWAWCRVERDRRVTMASGTITAREAGLPWISSNLAELLAAVEALEAVPNGWAGRILTDSSVTAGRLRRRQGVLKLTGIPAWLRERLEAVKRRLGAYKVELLAGHPTREELEIGRTSRGRRCSPHNVYCDMLCRDQTRRLWRKVNT